MSDCLDKWMAAMFWGFIAVATAGTLTLIAGHVYFFYWLWQEYNK